MRAERICRRHRDAWNNMALVGTVVRRNCHGYVVPDIVRTHDGYTACLFVNEIQELERMLIKAQSSSFRVS